MKEIWKDIDELKGTHQISNLGNVRSLDRIITRKDGKTYKQQGKLLSPFTTNCGYKNVTIRKDGKQVKFTVHRLVAKAFIPNPLNKEQVNHINGIKTDNKVSNLEWNTPSENIRHGFDTGLYDKEKMTNRMIEVQKMSADKCKLRVAMVDPKTLDTIKVFNSFMEAAQYVQKREDANSSNISAVCKGKRETANGFKWKYVE